jgi:hypothetical protein
MSLATLTAREASIFACLTDTVVAPEPVLPPVRETTAVEFLDRWLTRAPRLNSFGLRGLLYVVELSPLLAGQRHRLRRLDVAGRAAVLERLDSARSPVARQVVKLLKGIACLSYYGDDRVMLQLGYDADANVERARRLRAEEGRP